MKINSNTRLLFRLQQVIFYIFLVIAIFVLAKFSIQTDHHWDWTKNNRNTLSETTQSFLAQLDEQVTIQVFVSPNNEYQPVIKTLLNRYQVHSTQLDIHYIDPDFAPNLVRELNIQQQGEILISKGEQQQHLFDLSEQSLTNGLITVARQQEQWLVFIEGHGERSPLNQANFNLSTWGQQLKQKGFKLQGLNLVEHSQIPANAAAVIIASPERPWLAGEVEIIKDYIEQGGNLLWLTEPSDNPFLLVLAEQLAIEFVAGTVMDPNAQLLGIDDPQFVLITEYAQHPIQLISDSVTIFPQAVAMETSSFASDWQHSPLLITQQNVWSETSNIEPNNFDIESDSSGPLNLGYLITRLTDGAQEQRIAVIGDGDFLSNTYIGNAANLELGIAVINWLVHDDSFIAIPVKTRSDSQLELSRLESLVIGLGFLVVLPTLLLTIGLSIWWYRRRR
ncbi:mucin 2 [Methylophaga sp. 41_12_T18]|nr:mucin 2 [Methylophaga sp. 41_12_T18]